MNTYITEETRHIFAQNSSEDFGAINITRSLQNNLYAEYLGLFYKEANRENQDSERLDDWDSAAFNIDFHDFGKRQYENPLEAALFA